MHTSSRIAAAAPLGSSLPTSDGLRAAESTPGQTSFVSMLMRHVAESAPPRVSGGARELAPDRAQRTAEAASPERDPQPGSAPSRTQAERARAGGQARARSESRPAEAGAHRGDRSAAAEAGRDVEAEAAEEGAGEIRDEAGSPHGLDGWLAALQAGPVRAAGPEAGFEQADPGSTEGDNLAAGAAQLRVGEAARSGTEALAAALAEADSIASEPGAGKAQPGVGPASDERARQAAQGAATGLDAVHMLGGADAGLQQGSTLQDGAQHAGFESALAAAQAAGASVSGSSRAAVSESTGHVAAPVGTAGFAEELGEQVRLLVSAGGREGAVQEARLSLNPAELGPITIRIALEGQHAQVEFTAASETTRRAIEDSLPQLAGALQSEGLTLAGGGVYQQSREAGGEPGADPAGPGAAASRAAGSEPGEAGTTESAAGLRPRPDRGLVDLYA